MFEFYLKMPTSIYLLRHAEALHNVVPKDYIGDPSKDEVFKDAMLTEIGHAQTALLKPQIAGIKFDNIYCSPLRRCCQTLKESYPRSVHLDVKLDDRLLEQPYGAYISNHRHEKSVVVSSNPVKWDLTNVSENNPFVPKKKADEYNIIGSFIAEILEKHRDERVLIVTHGRWIRRFLKIYFKSGRYLNNCECIQVSLTPDTTI